jgi:hypothetical protein
MPAKHGAWHTDGIPGTGGLAQDSIPASRREHCQQHRLFKRGNAWSPASLQLSIAVPALRLPIAPSTAFVKPDTGGTTMADFASAFAATMKAEGGYVNDPQDPGGETYKGIARKMNSKWDGWILIDLARKENKFPANLDSNAALQAKIKDFYEVNYWDKILGDKITNQSVAECIFDFAVNAGPITSAKLAQITVGVEADGTLDHDNLDKINAEDPRVFIALFSLHKIARYVHICEKRQESKKFFYGWVKRTLEAV